MDVRPQVWKEGFDFKGPPIDALGCVVKHELRLGRAESLLALTKEYHFFTPAIVYLLGLVGDAPLIDFTYEVRQNVPFYFKKFRWPILRGLQTPDGDVDWNHAVWAVHNEHWDAFLDFYCSVAVHNRDSGEVNRIAAQNVKIVDPLAIETFVSGDVPALTIVAFGIDGTAFAAAFEQSLSPLLDPPIMKFYSPRQRTRVFARAIARGDNPLVAEELFLQEKLRRPENGQGQ